jgi:molybdenum transport protein
MNPPATLARLRDAWPERRIVVEVGDEAEAALWLDAGADVLQLEKLPVAAVALHRRHRRASPARR